MPKGLMPRPAKPENSSSPRAITLGKLVPYAILAQFCSVRAILKMPRRHYKRLSEYNTLWGVDPPKWIILANSRMLFFVRVIWLGQRRRPKYHWPYLVNLEIALTKVTV